MATQKLINSKADFKPKEAHGGKVTHLGTLGNAGGMGPQNRNQASVSIQEATKRMFRGTSGHQ